MKTRKTPTAKKASSKKHTVKAKSAAKPKKFTAKPATKAASRPGSKKEIVLALLRRESGATLAEIAKATGWQNHSVRGFISATIGKKLGLKVESTKNEAGERTYRTPA